MSSEEASGKGTTGAVARAALVIAAVAISTLRLRSSMLAVLSP